MNREELTKYLAQLLSVQNFNDYCPNGLQVEGNANIDRIVTGVTANQALIDAAIRVEAQAIIVHHGFFWKNEDPCFLGIKQRRIKSLLAADINLFAYHLPLDAHPLLGNNAQLARLLNLTTLTNFGAQQLGCIGTPQNLCQFSDFLSTVRSIFGAKVQAITPTLDDSWNPMITQVAWCSGAAQDFFEAAIAQGAQVFISGEISERCVHIARECGVAYLVCGHHATERYGVQALGAHLSEQFALSHSYIDIDSPI